MDARSGAAPGDGASGRPSAGHAGASIRSQWPLHFHRAPRAARPEIGIAKGSSGHSGHRPRRNTLGKLGNPARNERRARHLIKPMTRLLGASLIACALFGQVANSPPAAPTAYTVASIKPNKSSDDRFMLRPQPGGGLTATGVTLKMLIMFAYGVAGYQISDGPAWIGTERWDIEAKTDRVQGQLPPTQSGALLQALIEDRF